MFLLASLFLGAIFYKMNVWQNPGPYPDLKPKDKQGWEQLISNDPNHKHAIIKSMNYDLDIHYVPNAKLESFNPYFPIIHMTADDECNAWLQIVKTDSKRAPQWRHFIDSWPKGHEYYPFYTNENNFWDVPSWRYGIFSKELSYWIGHAYAIHVDHVQKTIKCLGGISWGYRLVWWWLRPIMIQPTALEQKDWQIDWLIFQKELPGYINI